MAEETIVLFTSDIGKAEPVEVRLQAEITGDNLWLSLGIHNDDLKMMSLTDIKFSSLDQNIVVDPPKLQNEAFSLEIGAFSTCLATCAAGNIVKEIMACIAEINNAGNRVTASALLKCLKRKGASISMSLAQCVIECIPSLN